MSAIEILMSEALKREDRDEYFRLLDLQCLGNGYYYSHADCRAKLTTKK